MFKTVEKIQNHGGVVREVCALSVLMYNFTNLSLHPLQRKLREISTKYQLFQKPANFEQRMLDCKRVLDGAKAELHILDVGDVDPEKIQSHLGGCMVRATTFCVSLLHKHRWFICF